MPPRRAAGGATRRAQLTLVPQEGVGGTERQIHFDQEHRKQVPGMPSATELEVLLFLS